MSADLHIHSNMSDGTYSPKEVVDLAKTAGLTTIALTDHDNVDGILPAQERGKEVGVEVIPGIEFTTELPRAELHILGYFINSADGDFTAVLETVQADRVKRIYKIVDKLKQLGIQIEPEDVFSISGKKAPGRPHVARALIKKGAVATFKEAFNRYLDHRSPAFVPHYKLAPAEAVKVILKAGGIAVLAHPVISNYDEIIPELMSYGLRGIEIYYTGYSPEQVDRYLNLARKYGLLATGGSDFHGADSGRDIKLGEIFIPDALVEKLRNEHLRGN